MSKSSPGKPKSSICADSNLSDAGTADETPDHQTPAADVVKVVHRDQDNISSFCMNSSSFGLMAIATPKEIQELNIAPLLEPVPWLEEETEYDIKNLLKYDPLFI